MEKRAMLYIGNKLVFQKLAEGLHNANLNTWNMNAVLIFLEECSFLGCGAV
jgi:hypothetical protein